MKSTFTRLLVLSLTVFLSINVWGQTFPYRHGFENATENSSWTMVADNSTSVNKWVIGTATSLTPTHSLYVSYNDGANAGYNEYGATVIMAYRSLTIPAGGIHSVYLDYRNHNVIDGDTLFICWVDDASVTIPANTGGVLPSWVAQYAKTTETVSSAAWKSSSFTVCGGTTGRLVFVWKKNSTNSSSTENTNAIISIDNIQINRNTHYSYYTGFDTPEEIDGWTLHNASTVTNKWTIGAGISMSTPNALYISDNNRNFYYNGSREGFVSAVKEFVLPAGEIFNIEFEYIAGGDANDYMYVSWLDNPADTSFNSWSNNTNLVSPVIRNNARVIKVGGNQKIINRTPAWTHGAFQVTGTGRPAKLVFYWVNNSVKQNQPAAAIDNFTIRRGLDNSLSLVDPQPATCATPIISNVSALGGAISVTWDDDGTSVYHLAYRNTYDTLGGMYRTFNNVRSPYVINGLTKGSYSLFIRKVCDNAYTVCGTEVKDTSAWAATHQHIILTGEGCINYGDISNPTVVTATYGSWSPPAISQAFQTVGVVADRHKLITKLEYDPQTVTNDPNNPGLLTIPYGELATVRLGNEQTGAQCEGLTYNLTVDPDHSLLIMKYAVVLQDPEHPSSEQPRFRLELLDANGNEIDPTCGKLLFVPGINTENWTYVDCGSGGYNCVKWKNWTTIGLNLQQYAGQTIKIRLSTWDCSQTGHYGYAYFMLNCEAQNFTGFSCDENSLDTIYAPDGFAYCWYKKYRPDGTAVPDNEVLANIDCLSTKRGFIPTSASDTNTYVCKIMLKTENGTMESCFFNLTANLAPRIPEARQTNQVLQENCQNWVQFTDASIVHVGTVGSGDTEPTNDSRWVIRQNNASGPIVYQETERNPRLQFPAEGGTYHVTLTAIYSSACKDVTSFTITVPPVGDIIVNQKITTCVERLPYSWRGRSLSASGQYTDRVPLASGCDSVFNLDFTVAESIEVNIDSTICQGESVVFEGDTYTTSGTYSKTYPTSIGCDSVITLNLTVNPVMQISITPFQSPICADDPQFGINYTNAGGSDPTKYTLTFGDNTPFAASNGEYSVTAGANDIVIPIPVDIRPDLYSVKIDFADDKYNCEGTSVTVPFEVSYKSSTIEQNWGDVIAVLNNSYNGGYQFSGYQWYKNGQAIEGETKSYLYIADGLEIGADYKVHLTRVGENYAVFTCPIKAQPYTGSVTPSFALGSSPIRVYNVTERARINIYTTTGVLVSSQTITPEKAEYIAPANSGVYIVNMLFDSGIKRVFKIVVGQ